MSTSSAENAFLKILGQNNSTWKNKPQHTTRSFTLMDCPSATSYAGDYPILVGSLLLEQGPLCPSPGTLAALSFDAHHLAVAILKSNTKGCRRFSCPWSQIMWSSHTRKYYPNLKGKENMIYVRT